MVINSINIDNYNNITDVIQNNPLTILSNFNNQKLLLKNKDEFKQPEEKLFINNYYKYLNTDIYNNFEIIFINVSNELGYKKQVISEKILKDNFKLEKDYILKENTIFINFNCFKLFCIKSITLKSNIIYDYLLKLETIINNLVLEENDELKLKNDLCKRENDELKLKNDLCKRENDEYKRENNNNIINKTIHEKTLFFNDNFWLGSIIPSVIEKITNNINLSKFIL